MRLAHLFNIMIALTVSACSQPSDAQQSEKHHADIAVNASEEPFIIGVQTHFGQNWPNVAFRALRDAPIEHVRDGLQWASVEREQGKYDFGSSRLSMLRNICDLDRKLLLTIDARNPIYDAGKHVSSDEGRRAFVSYLDAVQAELGQCLDGFEIGNEINGEGKLDTANGVDGREAYIALLKEVSSTLKQKRPDLLIVGGSSNSIATGFLARLIELGMLDHVDAIAVHPYRSGIGGLAWEIAHLRATIAASGKSTPIWATEFGDRFETYDEAADAMTKMLTVMSANGIDRAYWYALIDQSWFPKSGLYSVRGREYPAAKALETFVRLTGKGGRASAEGDGIRQLYSLPEDRWVVWGSDGDLQLVEGSVLLKNTGSPIEVDSLGEGPIFLSGPKPERGPGPLVADSLIEFGQAPWTYHARDRQKDVIELGELDGQFATGFGSRFLRPLRIDAGSAAVAGTIDQPVGAIIRYTPPSAARLAIRVCLRPSAEGAGIAMRATEDGRLLSSKTWTGQDGLMIDPIDLSPGNPIDFEFSPAGQAARGNSFRYRIQFLEPGSPVQPCAQNISSWSG